MGTPNTDSSADEIERLVMFRTHHAFATSATRIRPPPSGGGVHPAARDTEEEQADSGDKEARHKHESRSAQRDGSSLR